MLQRLFPYFAFLSVILLALSLYFWGRSGHYTQKLTYTTAGGTVLEVSSGAAGRVDGMHVGYTRVDVPSDFPPLGQGWEWESQPLPPAWRMPATRPADRPQWSFAGVKYWRADKELRMTARRQTLAQTAPVIAEHTIQVHTRFLVMPFWLPVILFAILPLTYVRRVRLRHQRLEHGLCPKCGRGVTEGQASCANCGYLLPA